MRIGSLISKCPPTNQGVTKLKMIKKTVKDPGKAQWVNSTQAKPVWKCTESFKGTSGRKSFPTTQETDHNYLRREWNVSGLTYTGEKNRTSGVPAPLVQTGN